MARSSLLGIDKAPGEAPGRDTEALGPGDSSDSASDIVGLEDLDDDDPLVPVDVALREDSQRSWAAGMSTRSDGDTSGTGEQRAAAGDPGEESADIGVDRIVSHPDEGLVVDDASGTVHDDEDPDLHFTDQARDPDPAARELHDLEAAAQAGDPLEDEPDEDIGSPEGRPGARRFVTEDEAADPVGDGESDARFAARERGGAVLRGMPRSEVELGPVDPGRPNPDPDLPADGEPGNDPADDPRPDEDDPIAPHH
jgi:hypothetical protein